MKKIAINGSNYSYYVLQRNLSYLLLLLGIGNKWESFDNVNIKNTTLLSVLGIDPTGGYTNIKRSFLRLGLIEETSPGGRNTTSKFKVHIYRLANLLMRLREKCLLEDMWVTNYRNFLSNTHLLSENEQRFFAAFLKDIASFDTSRAACKEFREDDLLYVVDDPNKLQYAVSHVFDDDDGVVYEGSQEITPIKAPSDNLVHCFGHANGIVNAKGTSSLGQPS